MIKNYVDIKSAGNKKKKTEKKKMGSLFNNESDAKIEQVLIKEIVEERKKLEEERKKFEEERKKFEESSKTKEQLTTEL